MRAGRDALPVRLITNATTFHLPKVAETLRFLDGHGLDKSGCVHEFR